ncbi:MAG: serine/threonine protein kinase [Planctomycetia bacterium]|nr:serine/threonine protein kinase [Planctomycetia bacterium]
MPPELPQDVQPHAADPSRRLGRYVLVKRIGKGGQSEVWRAWDTLLARHVAVKILKDAEPEDVTRFQREANILANLHHPNIAPVFGMEQEGDRAFIAMQLVDGETIDRMNAPLTRKVECLRDAARALHFAHRQGIIHRDIKPSNIMATADGHLYLMDFGIARPVRKGATITQTDFLVGTPAYMSPEQARGGRCDERTDVYALGATLYRLATHSDPFYGDDPMQVLLKVTNEAPPLPRTLEPSIPRPVEDIIRVAMAKEPGARHQTAEDFAAQLDLFLAGKKVRSAPRERIRIPQGVWIGILGVTTVAAVAWAIFKPPAVRANPGGPSVVSPEPAPPAPKDDEAARALSEAREMLGQLRDLDPADRPARAKPIRDRLAKIPPGHPDRAGALLETARLENLLGNAVAALAAADAAVEADAASAPVVLLRARLRIKRGLSLRTRRLASLDGPASANDPTDVALFVADAAADTPEIRALFQGADRDLAAFQRLSPSVEPADAAFVKGLAAFNAGKFREAALSLKAAAESLWLGADARLLLGIAHYMSENFAAGEASLARAGSGDDVIEARLLLAMLLGVEVARRGPLAIDARPVVELLDHDFVELAKVRPKSADWLARVPLSEYWRRIFRQWIQRNR